MLDHATRQIWFINAAHIVTHYCLLILATAALGMVAEAPAAFGTESGWIIALGTGMFVLYGLGALPMARLERRFGRKALMAAFFLGGGGAMVLAGFAQGPVTLALALGLLGAFAAIYHPIGTAMLVEAAGPQVGRAMGINGAFGNIGVALAPIVSGFLAAKAGWGWAFIVPGLLTIGLGLLWLREPLFDSAKVQAGQKPFPEIPPAVVRRAVVVLLAIASVSGLIFNAFALLLPTLMKERLASAPELLPVVGSLAFLATLCGGLTQFTVGRMIDRRTLKTVFLPLAVLQLPCFLALAFVQGWLVLPIAAVLAASIFGQVTVNETMAARYIAPPLRVRMYGIRFTIGFMGAALASPLVGKLHEATGSLVLPLLLLAGFGSVAFLAALAFPNRPEELQPELWAKPAPRGGGAVPAAAE